MLYLMSKDILVAKFENNSMRIEKSDRCTPYKFKAIEKSLAIDEKG